MKQNPITYLRLTSVVLGVVLCASLLAQEKKPAPAGVPTRIAEELITVTATVEAIDVATRELTLKGPLGNRITFTADDRVERLAELKVGDAVTAVYYIGVAAELRAPTAEEKAEPLVILEGKGKAPAGVSPRGGALRALRVVATVEGIDRPTRTVTLKGPLGRYVTVRVEDPARLTKLRLDDTVVVVCADAVAISVEKADK